LGFLPSGLVLSGKVRSAIRQDKKKITFEHFDDELFDAIFVTIDSSTYKILQFFSLLLTPHIAAIWPQDIQHNDIRHNNTQHNGLNCDTLH
jgi:hypothetical protein